MSANAWLTKFSAVFNNDDRDSIEELFQIDGFWRDYLPFGGTLQTLEGRDKIGQFAKEAGLTTTIEKITFEGGASDSEGFFHFETSHGLGRGYVRISDGLCETLFTQLDNLKEKTTHPDGSLNPFVLIVGGGQGGLALGAQLADLGVNYLIVDKHPRVGDQWRSRYDSLVLHDPVWYDHLPFKPFPSDWPTFTPKDQMADWLESYAHDLNINIWTNSKLTSAKYIGSEGKWAVTIENDSKVVKLEPTHLVMALGLSGFPKIPTFKGKDIFKGPQHHSSAFKLQEEYSGLNVAIVGANNSANDIASDLVKIGARPTLIQRSTSLVVRQDDYCDKVLGPLYSADAVSRGITTDKADILQASVPLRLLEKKHKKIWDSIRQEQKSYYNNLANAGFALDFAEDGTGLGMKYRRTASGYYIDVGAAEMIMDGRISVKSGHSVSALSEDAIHLDDGSSINADMIVYATGYGDMTDWVAALIDQETAVKVGPCWGYGSATKGDPGPWIGELRNMWVKTEQENLWFTGGNLSQARYYSRLLALQLAKHFKTATSIVN
jgi:putative flavoprotein involved in K+ transport